MRNGLKILFLFVMLISIILPTITFAQFEGIIKQRSGEAEMSALYPLIIGNNQNDAFYSDNIDLQSLADKIFKLSNEEFEKMFTSSGEGFFTTTTTLIKGKNIRTDIEVGMGLGKMTTIIRGDQKVLWTIYWSRKSYLEISLAQMNEKMSELESVMDKFDFEEDDDSGVQRKLVVKKTGKSSVVNGFKVDQYVAKNKEEISMGWINSDNKKLMNIMLEIENEMSAMMPGIDNEEDIGESDSDPFSKYGLPVLTKTVSKSNCTIEEILSFEKKPMKASDFNIPAGFKKMNMQDLMNR